MDLDALAAQFGGTPVGAPPATDTAPVPAWAQNLSRKDQAELTMKMYEEGRKRLAALQQQLSERGSTMDDLREFGRLNRESPTGSLWQQLTPDVPALRSDKSMEMAAIQARLAPAQREPGSGASSDRDVALFLRGLPSLQNPGPVNRGIREDFERKYNEAVEKAQAMERHLQQYGNLLEFDSMWANRNQKKPAAANASQPAPTMRFNPKTGKLEQVK